MNRIKLAVYDNGGRTADRYTIVPAQRGSDWAPYVSSNGYRVRDCLVVNDYPTHPSYGFSQMGTCTLGRHLGRKILFESLSEDVQAHVLSRLALPGTPSALISAAARLPAWVEGQPP